MSKQKIVLKSAEEAMKLVDLACGSDADVVIYRGKFAVDAKSIVGVLSLDFSHELDLEYDESNTALAEFAKSHAATKNV